MARKASSKPSLSKDSTANLGDIVDGRSFDIRNSGSGISPADIAKEHADTFRNVQHPDWQRANAEVRMWN